MTRKKKTQPTPRKASQNESPWNRFVNTMYRPRILLLVMALALSPIVYGLVIKKFPRLDEIPESYFTVSEIHVADQPEWVPENFLEKVWKQEKLPDQLSIHDEGLIERLAETLKKSPWVEKVNRIELRPLADVHIALSFRKPIAFVRTLNGLYPIDRNGILLPTSDFVAKDRYRFPLISSAYSIPQGPAGTYWGDLSMIGAARLAELLTPNGDVEANWNRFGFDAIEIPRATKANRKLNEVEYQIRTKGGSLIIWGDAPGINRPREPGAEQKLKRIEKYWTDFGGFEKPHGPYVIDIRHWNSTHREPIAAWSNHTPR